MYHHVRRRVGIMKPAALAFIVVICFTYLLPGCKGSAGNSSVLGMEKLPFSAGWDFHLGSIDSLAAFHDTENDAGQGGAHSDAMWHQVRLPHDWSIKGIFSANSPAGNQGGALPGGIGWYRKVFELTATDSTKQLFIDFEGIYRDSEVWINGHLLGERPNGFISFRYAMTPYLFFDGRPNVLLVRVDNSAQPNSRWYTGSGINRDVWLLKKGPLNINATESFLYATVNKQGALNAESVDTSTTHRSATLHQQLVVDYNLPSLRSVKVKGIVYDQNHQIVARKSENWQPVKICGTSQINLDFELNDFKSWSPDMPYLYTWVVELWQKDQLVDRLTLPLGIRSFHFDSQKGFYLNGQPTKIKGVCLHSDYGVLGTAYNYSAMYRQLALLKKMGCNAIRTAHNPPPIGMLELCDSMGFLVMDEAFDMWQKKKTKYDYSKDFATWHKRDLQDQIKRDRQHPAVFMWSIGNEIREQFDSSGTRLTKQLVAMVKELDTTRPVTAGLTETHPDKNYITKAGALDVLGFNYKIFDYDSLPGRFPGQALVASETVSALETRGVYKNVPKDDILYMPTGPKQKYGDNINGDWTLSAYDKVAAYWGTTHERAWAAVKSRPFMAGTFVWTGIDYLGEPVPFAFPARSSYYGIIDQAGLVKDIYYFYQSEWTNKAVLHVLPHWNWKKGEVIDVWCYYSKADEVELFLNGKSLGKRHKNDGKPGDSEFHVSWKVPYEPGILKAVSIKNGQVVLGQEIKTAGAPNQLGATVDLTAFRGLKEDLCYVTITLEDQLGIQVPDQDQVLHFELEGAKESTIVGINNGYQADLTSFQSRDYSTWKGKCVVVIRPGAANGSCKLLVTGRGLKEKAVTINFGR